MYMYFQATSGEYLKDTLTGIESKPWTVVTLRYGRRHLPLLHPSIHGRDRFAAAAGQWSEISVL